MSLRNRLGSLLIGDFRISLWRTSLSYARGRRILVARGYRVAGISGIDTRQGRLMCGTQYFGFADRRLRGLLRVRGRLNVVGVAYLGQGCRWDIGPAATVSIGDNTYFGPEGRLIISNGLAVGADCAVSWNVEFLDDDMHSVNGHITSSPITIGSHVWIGSGVQILRGTRIASGCIVAAGSVVRGEFLEEGCLIGGVPAKILRREVVWG